MANRPHAAYNASCLRFQPSRMSAGMAKRPHLALGEMDDIVRTFVLALVVNSSFYINEWIVHCNGDFSII